MREGVVVGVGSEKVDSSGEDSEGGDSEGVVVGVGSEGGGSEGMDSEGVQSLLVVRA